MFYIEFHGQSFRKGFKVNTLHSGKILATKYLEYNMSATIYEVKNNSRKPICTKKFWNNLDKFGWSKWEVI